MKVAFYSNTILEYGGGLEKYYIEITDNLSLFYPELSIDIITLNKKFSERIFGLLRIYYFKNFSISSLFKETESEVRRRINPNVNYIKVDSLKQLANTLDNYDFIYSKNELIELIILKFILKYKNIPPVILGCHTPIYYPRTRSVQSKIHNFIYNSAIYKCLASGIYKFHVINSSDEAALKKMFRSDQVIKIYNPFNFDEFVEQSNKFSSDYDFDGSKFNILWAGRLTEQKGVSDLIKIVELVNSSKYKNEIVWNICGDGLERDKILDLEKKWNNVKYFGHVESKYMASLYKKNNLFISTSAWEGFPYNLLEAQSVGLPVLSYNVSGCNEIIENGINGILVENTNQFVKGLQKIVDGKYFFRDIDKFINRKFDPTLIYNEIKNLFIKH